MYKYKHSLRKEMRLVIEIFSSFHIERTAGTFFLLLFLLWIGNRRRTGWSWVNFNRASWTGWFCCRWWRFFLFLPWEKNKKLVFLLPLAWGRNDKFVFTLLFLAGWRKQPQQQSKLAGHFFFYVSIFSSPHLFLFFFTPSSSFCFFSSPLIFLPVLLPRRLICFYPFIPPSSSQVTSS